MIVMIGAFPPPVHGMANVNKAMHQLLSREHGKVIVIDISASSLNRSLLVRLERVYKVLAGILALLWHGKRRHTTVYMSVSGGGGQLYEALCILSSKIFRAKLWLHHHSFAYLGETPSALTTLLTRLAGPRANHICLSAAMAERLRALYPAVGSTFTLSNVVLLEGKGESCSPRQQLLTIGYLSNIAREKGVFHFLDFCESLDRQGLSVKAAIAGPFQDTQTEESVRARLAALPNVEYLGPVYGDAKQQFFTKIDVLAFPTVYANEAEPLTIHEALSNAVPVITFDRGAIGEVITEACGLVIPKDADFAGAAVACVQRWLEAPDEFNAASCHALLRFEELKTVNQARLEHLIQLITQNPAEST